MKIFTALLCFSVVFAFGHSVFAQDYSKVTCDQFEKVTFLAKDMDEKEIPVTFSLCNKSSNLYLKAESYTFDQFYFIVRDNNSLLPFEHGYTLEESRNGFKLVVVWSETDHSRDGVVTKKNAYRISLGDKAEQLLFREIKAINGAGPH